MLAEPDQALFLGGSLYQEGGPAGGAWLGDRFVPENELALRIAIAAIEGSAAARLALNDLALFALRTGNPCGFLLDVATVGIVAAGGELAISAMFEDQVGTALGAFFIQRGIFSDLGLTIHLDCLLGVLTLGIAGAGQKGGW